MKRLFVALLGVLIAAGTLWATPACFQSNSSHTFATSATVTLPNVTGGDFLVVGVESDNSQTGFNVSDGVNGAYTQAVLDNFANTIAIYYFAHSAASASTLTVTVSAVGASGNITYRLAVAECSGVAASSPLDGTAHAHNASTALASGTFAATSGDLVIGEAFSFNPPLTAGAGYTALQNDPGDGEAMLEDQILSGTSANATATSATSGSWQMAGAAFTASGAPSKTCTLSLMGAGPC